MVAAVRLTVVTGPHRNRRFCFCGPTRCLAGRSLDCLVRFAGTERDQLISRQHCRLDIDPPKMLVEDLRSVNGTYVNGKKVGANSIGLADADGHTTLDHGDLLTIGGTTLRVDILECPHAHQDGTPVWPPGETVKLDCPELC